MERRRRNTTVICAAMLALLVLLSACAGNAPTGTSPASSERTSEKSSTAAPETKASDPGTDSTDPKADSTNSEPASTALESIELTLANLNIKHGAEGLDKVAEAIREISPEIIGLEEVDVNCERSDHVDEPAVLAELAGYPYYAFAKAIPLGAGEYGTAILSRYPIESFEVTPLDSGNGENRAVGHAVITVEGIRLDVFVTHLSFEDRSVRISQMKTIAGMLKKCGRYVLLGDLNSFNIEDIAYLEAAYYLNREDRHYPTFRRFGSSPDNIVLSEGFTEIASGVSDAECSDHKLLWGIFRLSMN